MKTKLIILLSVMINMLWAQSNSFKAFYEKYQDNEDFTSISISPKMFEMLAQIDIESEDEELVEVLQNLEGLKVIARESNEGRSLFNEAIKLSEGDGFEELINIRSQDGEYISIFSKDSGNIVKELLVVVLDGSDFAFIDLWGEINLKTIGKISKSIDAPGLEHLKDVKE